MDLPEAFFMASLLAMVLSSSEIIENFKHSLDMSSLELIDNFYNAHSLHRDMQPSIDAEHTYQHHVRKRRSNLNLYTIKTAQQAGNREELDVKSSIPFPKVPFMSEPADIVPIEIETENTVYAPERSIFFAIANYRSINGSYLSNVIIWRYNDSTDEFVIHQVLEEYAPYEIESFKASITPAQHKHFLAVAGYVEENDGTHPTKVSVYEIGPSPLFLFIKIQEFPDQNIRAIKYVEVQQTTYLMLGSYFITTPNGKQYNSASQVIVKRYDPISNFFHYYSSLPGSGVVDLESYTFNLKTYITVTNYRDNIGNLDIFSFIYIYNDKTKSFDIMQYLPTHGARDMKHFLLSNEDYLVVANEAMGTVYNKSLGVYSDIYKFINGKYYLIQSVETFGAKKWQSLAVPNCMQDILLFYADQRDNVDQVGLYTFSHVKESFKIAPFSIYHLSDVGSNFRPNPLSLATFSKQVFTTEESYLFLMIGANDTSKGSSVYKITYEVFFTDSPIDLFTREVNAKLIQLNNTLEEVKKMLSNAEDALNDAVKTNEDEVITGTKNFFNTVFINNGNVSKLIITNGSILHIFDNETDIADPSGFSHVIVDELYSNFSQLNQTVNNILDHQDKFMTLDQLQNITANMTFNELLVESMDIEADSNLNAINEIEFTSLINDLVTDTEPSIIFGKKTFNCKVTAAEIQLGSLNGLFIEKDLVINNTKQSITAAKTFKQKTIVRNNMNTGFINSLNLTEEVLLSDRPGVILGENIFNAPFSAGNIFINSSINDLQISDVFSDTFTKSTDQVITGFKQFDSIFSDDSINVAVNVNNYNLQELREKIGFKENLTTIYGNKIFNSTVQIETDLNVDGLVNGVDPSNYVKLSEDRNITALKLFEGDLTLKKDLAVSGKIDGMDLNELVTLDSDQEIFGSKTFAESLRVSGNFTVGENFTINDVDISQLVDAAVHVNNEENIDDLSLDEVVIYNSTIQGMINNDNFSSLNQLYSEVLHFNGDQIVTGRKQIDQLYVASNFYTTQLNSYNFPSDFARLNTDQIFQGQAVFEDNVVFKENIDLKGTINDIEVRRLKEDVITLYGNETVGGKKEFTQKVRVDGDIVVDGLVNGIDLNTNAMLLNGNQQVSTTKQFMSISYEDLLVTVKSDLDVSSTIDEIDLSDLNFAGMMISKNETITGSICFQQPNYNTSTHYINNIDLHALKDDIVTLNTDQMISSNKIFEIIQINKDLITASTIDEIDISELEANTFYENQTITVEGELKLSSNLIIHKDLLVTGNLLSGENIVSFDNFVSKSDNLQLENLTVSGNVQGNRFNISNINGLDMQKDIVYRTKQQTIDGFKTFFSASFGEIIVNGTINDVDVTRLHEQAVFKSKDQVIKGNKVFLENLLGTDIDSTYVNGFNITNLGLVRIEGLDYQRITATKTFHDFISLNNVTSVMQANGVNLKEFSKILVQSNKEQTVEGEIIFHSGFTVSNDIQVDGDLIATGLINGVNISNLNETTLKSRGNQVINTKTFTGLLSVDNLTVYENINGLNLPDDLLTKTTEQIVFGQKRFQSSLKTTSDVKVGKLINNVNISDLASSSLLKSSELIQKIHGEKSFLKNITMQLVVSDGKVDGLTINNDTFVTLHTDQEVVGDKTFVENLVCKNIKVEGKIVGIDLNIFNKSRVTKNGNQTIDSDVIFINDVYVYSNTTLSGLVNGIDLSEILMESPNITVNVSSLEVQLNTTLNKQCSSLTFTKASLEVGTSQLDFFKLEQNLPHKRVQHVEYFYIGDDEFIAVSVPSDDLNNRCTDSLIMKYNSSLAKFVDYQMIPTADVRKMIFFTTVWNASFLFVLNYDENCPKIKGPSQLYKWNATS